MAQDNNQVGSQPTSNAHQVPEALRDFDSLPDSANVRLPVVKALYGCSAATVWRMVKSGRLPHPRKISERITAWEVGALRKSLAAA
jgi:predicted DNA-binding transcriptional regulator AlpA